MATAWRFATRIQDAEDFPALDAVQFVTVAATGFLTNERTLTGTVNQINLADGGPGAALTLSTPQDIDIGATPTFADLTLSTQGAGGGILIGGDAQLYRGAADQLRTPDSIQIDNDVYVGIDDDESGFVHIYGNATGKEGGEILLYLSGDHDGVFETWSIDVWEDDLRFFRSDAVVTNVMTAEGQLQLPATGAAGGILIGGDTQLYRSAANVLRTPDTIHTDDEIRVGIDDTTAGLLLIYGDGTLSNEGGEIQLYTAADFDGAVNSYVVDAFTDRLRIRRTGQSFDWTMDANGNVAIGTTPSAKLHVDQSSTTGAIPVLYLDQADLSEEMIEFNTTIGVGNPVEAVGAKVFTTTHFVRYSIAGVGYRYAQLGTIA